MRRALRKLGMAYDQELVLRLRAALLASDLAVDAVREQPMFGGLTFMVNGHMCCGVAAQGMMVRVGPDAYAAARARAEAREMDFTGRPLKGMVFVDADGLDDAGLAAWVTMGLDFVRTLPATSPKSTSLGASGLGR